MSGTTFNNGAWGNEAGWQKPSASGDVFLPLENTPFEDDSWGTQQGFASIPLAGATAALSLSVAIINGINRYNDEITPQIPSETSAYPTPIGKRLRHSTEFKRWYQNDDLPVAAAGTPALDEGYWAPTPAPLVGPNGVFWATDEGSIPGVVPQEDYWLQDWRIYPPLAKTPAWSNDDLPVQAAATLVEEDYWLSIKSAREEKRAPYAFVEDDLPVTATTLVEETEWNPYVPRVLPSFVYLQDEDFPALYAIAEEFYWQPNQPKAVPPLATLSVVCDEIVPQPAQLPIDEMYWLTFPRNASLTKLSKFEFLVEDDYPILTTPATATIVEWLVRARRRGIR